MLRGRHRPICRSMAAFFVSAPSGCLLGTSRVAQKVCCSPRTSNPVPFTPFSCLNPLSSDARLRVHRYRSHPCGRGEGADARAWMGGMRGACGSVWGTRAEHAGVRAASFGPIYERAVNSAVAYCWPCQ